MNEEIDTNKHYCKHCGLNLELHDDGEFCPPGSEEFGGKR